MKWLDDLLGRPPMTPDAKAQEVADLTERSAETLRRVDELVRLARIDAELAAASARQRQP